MRTLELIEPGKHTADDLEGLLKADELMPQVERIPLARIDAMLRAGEIYLWRVHPGPGVILGEVLTDNGVSRLQLTLGSGRYGPSLHKILSHLSAYAKELGCECISTVVYSERFMRALVLCGASVEGWILTYSEAGHEQQEEN